jgi:predicted component of type VI protein secretion system
MEMGTEKQSGEKLRLKVVAGNATGSLIEVERELEIGRQAGGEGTLAEDIEISRRHARISGDPDGRCVIEDLGSTNGTFVNGRRVEQPTILETGDRIELGASALVVQVSTTQPTPPSSDTIAPSPSAVATEPGADAQPPPEPEADVPAPEPEAAPAPEESVPGAQMSAPAQAPAAPAPFALRIEVDPAAGRATVSLDESSDDVELVYEDGRWRML